MKCKNCGKEIELAEEGTSQEYWVHSEGGYVACSYSVAEPEDMYTND